MPDRLRAKTSMREVVVTLFLALILVVVVVVVFLQDWRATLIPAIAIPVSLLARTPRHFFLDTRN